MNRVENPEEILEVLRKDSFWKTAYFGIVMQNIVANTVGGQREAAELFCTNCKERCCSNKNHLHIADVLRFYYSGLEMFIPTFFPLPKGNKCQMLKPEGCSLQRLQRPLICVSFFCDPVSERYTDLYLLSRQIRAGMEALVKIFWIESGKISPASLDRQVKILTTLQQAYLEYKDERKENMPSTN